MHPDDEQILRTMLRRNDLPEHLVDLVERATWACHRANKQGPLGAHVLVGLVVASNVNLPEREAKPKTIWADVPVGSPVEAYFFGHWQPGILVDRAPNGALVVKLDDDPTPRECYPHVVKRPGDPDPKQPVVKPEAATATAKQLQPVAVGEAAADAPSDAVGDGEDPGEAIGQMVPEPIDWDSLDVGSGLYIEDVAADDFRDATFARVGKVSKKAGAKTVQTVFVKYDGEEEPIEVPVSHVTKAA